MPYPRQLLFAHMFIAAALFLAPSAPAGLPQPKIDLPQPFDDVRSVDLSSLDFSPYPDLPATLTYSEATIWPTPDKLPPGFDPVALMEAAKNPGLGVRALHDRGITGEGVKVGILDQPFYSTHPEYADNVVYVFSVLPVPTQNSLTGPAVCSLFAGQTCGTAPGALVHYAWVEEWELDASLYATALDRMVAYNRSLSPDQKIKIVSVSASPAAPGRANPETWTAARARAEADGILILEASDPPTGYIGACWFSSADTEDPGSCIPGFPNAPPVFNSATVLAPGSPRTFAQHDDTYGRDSYTYWGREGYSWSIPWAAGVLAMGWQVHPELLKDRMMDALFDSAHVQLSGAKIIDPPDFIQEVQKKVQFRGSFLAESCRFSLYAAALGTSYQWSKDGQPLQDDGRITGSNTRSLVITSLRQQDAGAYACSYNDGAVLVQTETFVLELLPPESLPAVSPWLLLALAAMLPAMAALKIARLIAVGTL